MDQEMLQTVARSIGEKVRAYRAARGWTLAVLASRSGVSRRMIVQIEQGQTNPSISVLLRLGEALGVGLPRLTAIVDSSRSRVVRAGEAPVLWRGEQGGFASLVAGTAAPDVLELWDWVLEPGDRHESEAHSPGTWEQLVILEGQLILRTSGSTVTLAAQDSVSFPGDQPHSYAAAAGADRVRFVLAVMQPGVDRLRLHPDPRPQMREEAE
ncbi:XRE family transcriptional regulator [Micromonospora sp. NPDC005324]|uniref:helix-turn-helix domain-containing protein n=1 Tax=Micromonospora sp. NPDC005324 TaxID=3157033 RepID=UPI0033A0E0D0